MRTNIVLDDALVEQALELSGRKTKRDVVDLALREYVQNRSRLNLMDLKGAIRFQDVYDYKSLRAERFAAES
jgi:Arc/MetJ family transcription regulator